MGSLADGGVGRRSCSTGIALVLMMAQCDAEWEGGDEVPSYVAMFYSHGFWLAVIREGLCVSVVGITI